MKRTVLIAGATGLVGKEALAAALADPRVGRVIAWGRRPPEQQHPHLEVWSAPDLPTALRNEPVHAVICALGTTIKAVKGDKAAFTYVDHDLVVNLGAWASGKGIAFCVVSALGADEKSLFFYNRVKGRMENALRSMDFSALHIFHPSILDGPRTEQRTGEKIGLVVMRAIAPLLPAASRPMSTQLLGQAALNAALSDVRGTHIHTYHDIRELAG